MIVKTGSLFELRRLHGEIIDLESEMTSILRGKDFSTLKMDQFQAAANRTKTILGRIKEIAETLGDDLENPGTPDPAASSDEAPLASPFRNVSDL